MDLLIHGTVQNIVSGLLKILYYQQYAKLYCLFSISIEAIEITIVEEISRFNYLKNF